MNRILSTTIVFVSFACAPLLGNAQDIKPDATIDISGDNVALGVGYTTANGTLHFDGKSYPVQLQRLNADEIDGARMAASGDVYHLTRLGDLNGDYAAVSTGAASGADDDGTAVQNQNGVVIDLDATSEGRNVSVEGFSMKLAR